MKHKRLLTLLLALCFILSTVPATAFAAEAEPTAELMGQINPMAENLPAAAVRSQSAELNSDDYVTADEFYTTAEPAAADVRAAMAARQATVVVGVTNDIYSRSLVYDIVEKALDHTGVPNEGDYLSCHGYSWEATIYPGDDGTTIEYRITYFTSANDEAQVDAAVDALLAELNLWNATDYEKIKGVYDWICTNVVYDYDGLVNQNNPMIYTAYAALIDRTSVCQGYAALFYRLMLELGVDCRVITGTVDEVGHAWNIVKLDGVYYNVDATFDAAYRQADLNYSYFLVSDLNFLDHVSDSAYTKPDFLAAYPKAEYNYDDSNDFALYGYCGAEGEYGENLMWVLQDGILVIYGKGAMMNCTANSPWADYANYIQGVYVDEGVTTIGSRAFESMSKLTEVYLSGTVAIIEDGAFFYCSKLQTINLPKGLTTIGNYAFDNCSSLTDITIPESVTSIGFNAFCSTGIAEITIPAGVTVLDASCFFNCGNLSFVTLSEGLLKLGDSCFMYCHNLTSLTLPESLERIESTAFRGASLTHITIPKNVNFIGYLAFLETPIETISFTGNAPEFFGEVFGNITATVYYPAGNETWTEEVMQQYGGTITWKPACDEHTFDHDIKNPTCTENGLAIHTCTTCGLSYEEVLPAAHTYTNDQDTICDVCTCVRHVDAEYPPNPPVVHMFRMYDPNSGEHFYTGSEVEKSDLLVAGWNYEGIGFSFPVVGAPVYRLYDPVYGEHLYTMDIDEVNYLIGEGWNNEGIAFNTAPETEVPQYRLHNPNEKRGAYHFTSSTEERDNLLAVGWEYQGIGWYSCWK